MSPVVQLIRPGNDGFPAYFVRIYASATTHVQVDLLGTISSNLDNRSGAGLPHRTKRRSAARRITNKLKSPR